MFGKAQFKTKNASRRVRRAHKNLATCLITLICLGACTQHKNDEASPKSFAFDYKAVSEATISKANPTQGDFFTARLRKLGADDASWEIASAPFEILDKKADGSLLSHLLDTLRTVKFGKPKLSGTLESFGLKPPLFRIQWRVGDKTDELDIGLPVDPSRSGLESYAMIPKQNGEAEVLTAQGALLRMLEYVDGFQSLRFKTLLTWEADDVDEIEFFNPTRKSIFYAQREGDRWTDRASKTLKGPVAGRLEQFTHLRILSFVDDPKTAGDLTKLIQASPDRDLVLRNRNQDELELKIKKVKLPPASEHIYATVSSRPNAVFEVFPEAIRIFEPPVK